MLQSIRDQTQGWIAGVIISILILSFALWGIHSYFEGGSVNSTVAEVNGNEITKGQLAVAYERLRRQLQSSNYELPPNAESGLKDRALQSLINIQVLKQASLKQNYRISPNQIDNFLESMPEFQVNGQFSVARFQQVLTTTLYSANEFLDLIKTSLLIDQPRLGMIFTSFSLPYEVADSIALVNQEREIQYVTLPFQLISKEAIKIPENKVQAYYQQHQAEFKTPEQVSIEYIELTVKDLMNKVRPAEEELKSFYNENTNAFAQPLQWKLDNIIIPLAENATDDEVNQAKNKINEIYAKAKEGIDLGALARLYSLGHSSVISQSWVTQNQVPTELQKALLTLTGIGQIASPVRINSGFVLLKAVGFKEAELMPYEQVKGKVSEALDHQKAEEQFTEMREKLASLTYEHPESLQQAAQELGLPVKVSELFTKEKGGNDISTNSKVREAAFSNEVLNTQNNSDVIQKSSDTVVVIRIKSHIAPSLLSLKTVHQQIEDKLKVNEIDAKTMQLANEIKQKLKNSANPEQILQQEHLSWNKVGWIARHSTNVSPAILDTAFEMPKPDVNHKISYAVTKVPNGYAVIALKAAHNGKLKNAEEYDVFAEQIQNSQGLIEHELYKQSLMSQAKIVSGN